MIKNTVIFGSLLFFATASFADDASNTDSTLEMFKPSTVNAQPEFWGQYIDTQNYPKKDDFKRYYVQFSFGIESDNFESDTEIGNTTDKNNYNAMNGLTTLTFGYGTKLDAFYLGVAADGSYNFANYEHTEESNISGQEAKTFSLKMPYSLGIYFVPGVFVTDSTMIYCKIGIAGSSFEASSDDPDFFNAESLSEFLVGLRVGAGLRVYINRSFSINGEYNFTYYDSATSEFNNITNKYTPQSNQFTLGLAFNF